MVPAAKDNLETAGQADVPAHLEPAAFGWTQSSFEARTEARQFSDKIYGDY